MVRIVPQVLPVQLVLLVPPVLLVLVPVLVLVRLLFVLFRCVDHRRKHSHRIVGFLLVTGHGPRASDDACGLEL